MAAPGTTVTVTNAPAPASNPASTGVAFLVGLTERGPVGKPVLIQSMADYATKLGARVAYGMVYDGVDVLLREGAHSIYVSRTVGPAAVAATVTLKDKAGAPLNTLQVAAKGPGTAGNNISVAVVAGSVANTFLLQITYSGTLVETSSLCAAPADAAAWSATSNYVTVTDLGSATAAPNNNPAVVAATPLAGGTDDNSNVVDATRTTALAAFTRDLGPGQVLAPGVTTAATHEALVAHALANNRVALCDAPDTATAATVTALVGTVQAGSTDSSPSTMCAPWLTYPAVPTGTAVVPAPRKVPPSVAAAALMARNDGVNDANIAAAGPNGRLLAALDVTQTYSDADLDALNTAGVCVFRNIANRGGVQLYGYRSMALDPNWSDLANVRFRMQLADDAARIASGFDFAQIDKQGRVISAFNGALRENLNGYWVKGSLYGATPQDAFTVTTSAPVNTDQTAANRQILAHESVRMSPSAEQVNITIIAYPVTQPIA